MYSCTNERLRHQLLWIISPCWRPGEYAEAILVVDGLVGGGLGREWVEMTGTGTERLQMLVRALIFRSISDTCLKGDVRTNDMLGKYKTAIILQRIFLFGLIALEISNTYLSIEASIRIIYRVSNP